jgi:ribosomal protein L13
MTMNQKTVVRRFARQAIKYAHANDIASAQKMLCVIEEVAQGRSVKHAVEKLFPPQDRKQAAYHLLKVMNAPSQQPGAVTVTN